jgi:hypothetical protein
LTRFVRARVVYDSGVTGTVTATIASAGELGPIPFTSLNSVSTDTAGAARDFRESLNNHSLIAKVAGFSGSGYITVFLQASHDGATWVDVDLVGLNADSVVMRRLADRVMARYVRARVAYDSGVTGTVTATIASCSAPTIFSA